jgi:predicted dehydrogenase
LGHYTRSTLIPRVTRFVDVACCHEIDPTQAGRIAEAPWEIRTSPDVDADEVFDVAFAAGFHHSHARIAAEALRRGKDVVVEKPLATTHEELDLVLNAAEGSRGRVFVAYQRRYSAFNRYLREDLRLVPGTPVSLSAIVYEVPLPRHHWYRWPASRGRIVCNGCHWIDYFLFLTEYRPVRHLYVRSAPNGDHVVQATLEDDASLSLVLTEVGSPRLNMRDIVRVASGSRSAVIIDQCRYESEGPDRIIRRARTRRADSFNRMYNAIAGSLTGSVAGDSLDSMRVSGTAVLDAQALAGDPLP